MTFALRLASFANELAEWATGHLPTLPSSRLVM
jgi:hypothetical protein